MDSFSIDAILNDPVARKELENKLRETSPHGFKIRATKALEDVVKQFKMLSKQTFKIIINEAYDNVHRDDIPKPLPPYQQFVKATFPIIREENPAMHAAEVLKIIGVMWADFNAWDNDNTTLPTPTTTKSGDCDSSSAKTQMNEELQEIVCASVSCKKGYSLASVGLTEMPANKRRWYCPDCKENNPRVGRDTRRRIV